MSFQKWVVAKTDKTLARSLAEECGVDPLVALLLTARGYTDPMDIEEFLSDDMPLSDPFDLPDMQAAVDRIESALQKGESIAVYGDYDCDGVTSAALLTSYLTSKGAKAEAFLPERMTEGYGLHKTNIDAMKAQGFSLVLTVDNGVRAVEEIDYAASLGVDVVVTDHHIPGEELPRAVAVVDPHRVGCMADYVDYAGVGVAFQLIRALEGGACEELLPFYGDLVALGTVADVVPLTGENRLLVRHGLRVMNAMPRPGLRALREAAGLNKRPLSSENVAFGLAPRINAAGRMGSARKAYDLLRAEKEAEAALLARQLCDDNILRQELEREMVSAACELIDHDPLKRYAPVLVVAGEGWHEGVLGIAAARLCDRYGKPALVISADGDEARGSARSVGEFDLYKALCACEGCFTAFGGHRQAAGFSLKAQDIGRLEQEICAYAAALPRPRDELRLDCKLNPRGLDLSTAEVLEALEPYGCENPSPLFGLYGMELTGVRPVGGGGHLRLSLVREGVAVTAMCFGTRSEEFPYRVGDVLDLAVALGAGEYNGQRRLTIIARALRKSGMDETALEELEWYERFCRGEQLPAETVQKMIPGREDTALVFRALKACDHFCFEPQVLWERLHGRMGYAKMRCALDILDEMHIITQKPRGGALELSLCAVEEKKDLEQSNILRSLRELERKENHGGQ